MKYKKWFAWHPVVTDSGWAWMRFVMRRWSPGSENGLPIEFSCWEHRSCC